MFKEFAEEIAIKTGNKPLTAVELADGFLRIAVSNMANAIKKISVQRGYDVTKYALQCFGGAGGQHACLVADALGIETIFIHPFVSLDKFVISNLTCLFFNFEFNFHWLHFSLIFDQF